MQAQQSIGLLAGAERRRRRSGCDRRSSRAAESHPAEKCADPERAADLPTKAQDAFNATGDNGTVTIRADQQKAVQTPSGATQSDVTKIDNAMPDNAPAPDPKIAGTTGNAGDAKFNPESGTLSFTQPGFDPTKQQFSPEQELLQTRRPAEPL